MARVTGPLMSVDASGTYAKSIVFSKWKGRNYVRELVTPTNPKSAKQLGVRSMMHFLAKAWAAIKIAHGASWATIATARAISTFNAYVSENLVSWQGFTPPTQTYPAAATAAAISVTTQTLTGGAGQITVQVTPSSATAIWGIAIFRDTAEITAPSWANCIAVIAANGANAVTHVDTPLVAGTYHYRTAVFTSDGVLGTVHADASTAAT